MKATFPNKITRIFAGFLGIFLLLGGVLGNIRAFSLRCAYAVPALTTAQLDALDLQDIRKLMIVAHPDDETLWGGAHLTDGGYLVVCITNGNNPTRAAEFQAVMKASGNVGLILSYPDKLFGTRDNWMHVHTQLEADLDKVLRYRAWDSVTTHNAAGEYGHIHHKMTHEIVTALYDDAHLQMPLYVFGKYYRAAVLPGVVNTLQSVSAQQLSQKETLLQLYASQADTIDKLSHMNPYENWTQIRGGEADANASAES